jgi:2-dehydro-3-deoxyphosphooctonate aldolase (KDO 8-P synthase)
VSQKYPFALISGPCVIESEQLCFDIATELSRVAKEFGVLLIFKASYDKANRTRLENFRGPGRDKGLEILAKVRKETGLPIITDIHRPEDAAPAAEIVDFLQIPAFLCRQTDLVVAAAKTGKPLNIKKGQFMAPEDMAYIAQKAVASGNSKIMLTERGTTFGYHDLVVDMRSLVRLAELGYPVIFDATHSVQTPSGARGASGGQPEFIFPLARAAAATGAVSGIFVETHPSPKEALSDGPNMLPLSLLPDFVHQLVRIFEALPRAVVKPILVASSRNP